MSLKKILDEGGRDHGGARLSREHRQSPGRNRQSATRRGTHLLLGNVSHWFSKA